MKGKKLQEFINLCIFESFMPIMRKLIFILIYFLFYVKVSAQFYSTGEAPASIRWKSIQTPHFTLIYPGENSIQANHMANLLEFYYPLSHSFMQPRVQKHIPVILHSSSVASNGYVTLAPWRMELILTPPQDVFAQDWMDQLALHETRHAAQLSMLNTGFTRGLQILTGEIGPGMVSAEIPQWLYEGDAVYNETLFSSTGRGRLPSFAMPLRTLLINQVPYYSYDKALLGSYRDFVPDHYLFGFQLVQHGRLKSNAVWTDAYKNAGKYPYLFVPVHLSLKKETGLSKRKLYNETLDSLKNQYINDLSLTTYTNYVSIHPLQKTYTQYVLPHALPDHQTVSIRYGLNDAGSMVVMDSTGKVIKRKAMGYSNRVQTDVHDTRIIWDEIVYDARWRSRSYSILRVWDIHTGQVKNLTRKSRYFSPDFSPDGKFIAVAETDIKLNNYITILNAQNGKIINRYIQPDKGILTPEWINMDQIVFISVQCKGKQLEILNLESGTSDIILPYTFDNISEPTVYENNIIFRSSRSGIENMVAISRSHPDTLKQVTHSMQGAFHPSIQGDHLLFSEYSVSGFQIKKIELDERLWIPVTDTFHLPWLSDRFEAPDTLPNETFQEMRYSKISHMFRFHSWLPFYADMEGFMDDPLEMHISPGFMLFSQNSLSTLTSSISYGYDQGYHILRPKIQWRGWYPVFELEGQIGGPHLQTGNSESNNTVGPYTEIMARTYVPLIFQSGSFYTTIQPMLEYEWSTVSIEAEGQEKKGLDYFHVKYGMNRFQRSAPRDIYPRWGQSIMGSYTRSFADKALFGDLFSIKGSAYFPGFFKHQSFIVHAGYQIQHPKFFYLPFNRMNFPRGYSSAVSREITEIGCDYAFPIAYPDWGLGPVIYIKRIRADLFYDWLHALDLRGSYRNGPEGYTGLLYSYGIELLADFHVFRILFPVSSGIRVGINGNNAVFAEFMMSIQTGNR